MASFNWDSIQNKLGDLMERISGSVSLSVLFSDEFMRDHGIQQTALDFFTGADVFDQDTYERWSDYPDNAYVRSHTPFQSWNEMNAEAKRELAHKRMANVQNNLPLDTVRKTNSPLDDITIQVRFTL